MKNFKEIIWVVVVIFFVVAIGVAYSEEVEEKPDYTSIEYVAQYLGETITISFLTHTENFNLITIHVEEITYIDKPVFDESLKKFIKNKIYYLKGKSEIAREVLIDLEKINNIRH